MELIICNCAAAGDDEDEERVQRVLWTKLHRLQKEKCLLKVWRSRLSAGDEV